MENKTMIARATVSEIQRKAKAFKCKKRARKDDKSFEKATTRTPKAVLALADHQIFLADKGKCIKINPRTVDLTVEEKPIASKKARL